MKILVIGGTYFLGRKFVDMAKTRHEITLINRGTNPYEDTSADVTSYCLDRRDADALSKFPYAKYDAIVDFCAYAPGDIKLIFDNLNAGFSHYIFISTVDVYKRGTGEVLTEDSPTEDRYFGGAAGDYIAGKILLEKELLQCASLPMVSSEVSTTIIRPAFIYGPGNYSPREGIYMNWIDDAGMILHLSDATGRFQLVNVFDVARGILACCECSFKNIDCGKYEKTDATGCEKKMKTADSGCEINIKTDDSDDGKHMYTESKHGEYSIHECFNLVPPEILTYDNFADALKRAIDKDFEIVALTVSEINERGIPLPFPLTEAESLVCSGKRSEEILHLQYTPLDRGLRETYLINLS